MKDKSTAVIYIVEDLRSKLNGNSVLFLDLLDFKKLILMEIS